LSSSDAPGKVVPQSGAELRATDATPAITPLQAGYLDLLKQSLTRSLFIEEEIRDLRFRDWRRIPADPVLKLLARRGMRIVRTGGDPDKRADGRDWPPNAETMVGLKRLDNVQDCIVDAVARGVPGDVLEAGVWRGGTTIFMRGVLRALGDTERRVWVADSFRGLPVPDPEQHPPDQSLSLDHPALAVSLDQVKANFAKYGLLDDQVHFLEGWFNETLASAPIDKLAVIRLDGDLYESTMDGLEALYPKLSLGGYIIIDDYHHIDVCRKAVADYRAEHAITEPIASVDWTAVYWQRLS